MANIVPSEFIALSLVQKDGKPSAAQFTASLEAWTEEGMALNMKFKDPLSISTGGANDQFKIDIVGPEFFTSKKTGAVLDPKDTKKPVESIPTQLPAGVKEKPMRETASKGSNGTIAVAIT